MKVSREQAEWVLILHDRWRQMRKRCVPNTSKSHHHGDKGIRVCRQWDKDFWTFFEWAKVSGFHPSLTLGRKRNSGNYCPSNCQWETYEQQNRNKTNNALTEKQAAEIKWLLSESKSPTAIANLYGVGRGVVQEIDRGRNWKSVVSKRPKRYTILLKQLPDRIIRAKKVIQERSGREKNT